MRVLVTGASGFVGRVVLDRLLVRGHEVIAATRRAGDTVHDGRVAWCAVGEVDGTTDWAPALDGADAAIHLVARTHQVGESADSAHTAYRTVNVEGTRRLAEQARVAGVGRLVFVSSVKAQAERADTPLTEVHPPRPEDAYGAFKLEAERVLSATLASSATRYTVIRPPLVYGPGVRANMRQLARAALAGWPLPFARVDNRRSLIGVDNLADLLVHALDHPAAADRVFLASDGADLSTPELIRRIARAGGRRARLVPVPAGWLRAGLRLAGRPGVADRLLGSLRLDSGRARRELGWQPPRTVDAGLEAMVADILASQGA